MLPTVSITNVRSFVLTQWSTSPGSDLVYSDTRAPSLNPHMHPRYAILSCKSTPSHSLSIHSLPRISRTMLSQTGSLTELAVPSSLLARSSSGFIAHAARAVATTASSRKELV